MLLSFSIFQSPCFLFVGVVLLTHECLRARGPTKRHARRPFVVLCCCCCCCPSLMKPPRVAASHAPLASRLLCAFAFVRWREAFFHPLQVPSPQRTHTRSALGLWPHLQTPMCALPHPTPPNSALNSRSFPPPHRYCYPLPSSNFYRRMLPACPCRVSLEPIDWRVFGVSPVPPCIYRDCCIACGRAKEDRRTDGQAKANVPVAPRRRLPSLPSTARNSPPFP